MVEKVSLVLQACPLRQRQFLTMSFLPHLRIHPSSHAHGLSDSPFFSEEHCSSFLTWLSVFSLCPCQSCPVHHIALPELPLVWLPPAVLDVWSPNSLSQPSRPFKITVLYAAMTLHHGSCYYLCMEPYPFSFLYLRTLTQPSRPRANVPSAVKVFHTPPNR